MTTNEHNVGFEISAQQAAALRGSDPSSPRRLQVVVDVEGALPSDLAVRARAAAEVHEGLRTAFTRPGGAGRHLQVVHDSLLPTVDPVVDAPAGSEVHGAARAAWAAALDTEKGPTVRITPVHGPDGDHLVLTAAAAAGDAESLRLLAGMLTG